MKKKTNLFIMVAVLAILAGCGTEKSVIETTTEEERERDRRSSGGA